EVKEEVKQELQAEKPETSDVSPAGATSDVNATSAPEEVELLTAPVETQVSVPETPSAPETPASEASPVSFIGKALKNSVAGLLNAIWDFINGIFNLGAKKLSSVPFIKNATASILKNSEELKTSGLLSPKAQNFTASLFVPMDKLFSKIFKK
ncbi:MAG: hypothetical protein AAB509_01225, partial [Patescibacteria group bacterium]